MGLGLERLDVVACCIALDGDGDGWLGCVSAFHPVLMTQFDMSCCSSFSLPRRLSMG